jgi:hypothetical protein
LQVVLISRREAGFHGIMAGNRRFGAAVIATARSCKEFSKDETLFNRFDRCTGDTIGCSQPGRGATADLSQSKPNRNES